MTQEDAVRAVRWSMSKIVRIEGGKSKISASDLRALLDLYGVSDFDARQQLLDLSRRAKRRAWWMEFRSAMAYGGAGDFVGIEAEASKIRSFELSVIPGLLQTRRYTEALLRETRVGGLDADFDTDSQRIELRQRRQRELWKRSWHPEMTYIVDEAAFRRGPTSPDIMIEQLEYLTRAMRRPQISLQIVPFSAGVHPAQGGAFALFDLGGGDEVAYQETGNDERFFESESEVAEFRLVFEWLQNISLSQGRTLALIREIREELLAD